MRRPILLSLLGGYALLAATPALVWLIAVIFTRVDDRFREVLGATGATLPIALGLAAITLAVHGLLLNEQLHDDVAAELDEVRERQLAAVAVGGGDAVASAGAGPSATVTAGTPGTAKTARTVKTARTNGQEKPSKSKRAKRRAISMARRGLRRSVRFP